MITADEVWNITSSTNGQTGWSSATSTNTFYFEGSQLLGKGTSKYAWLIDYTERCTGYGCNREGSGTFGYWTSTPLFGSSDSAWYVSYSGDLDNMQTAYSSYGVRPVITLTK